MPNRHTWEDWIAEHGRQLVLFARRWARDQAEAEDWVQEAFVRFWRRREDVADPLTYLYQCVRTVSIDAARKGTAQRRREEERAGAESTLSLFESSLESKERQRAIERALAQLPVEQAEVVTLKIWSELTLAQIAEVTGTPPGTVASRYRYALSHLRELLSERPTHDRT